MKQCIIADFEWCVTPYPIGERFQYFNEILSAGAVRIDENGTILDRFYTLIRPTSPDYLHPVVLKTLRLDRAALAAAPDFPTFFAYFRAFLGETDNVTVCTWGAADRSALLQNMQIKGAYSKEEASPLLPPMYDLQPLLCRAASFSQPYPGLSALLSYLHLENENRHNALSDAEDTAHVTAQLSKKSPEIRAELFCSKTQDNVENAAETTESRLCRKTGYATPGEALQSLRNMRHSCPVCGAPIGCGTWLRSDSCEMMTLCSCENDGRFLCTVSAEPDDNGLFTAYFSLVPFDAAVKTRYEAARRAVRMHRSRQKRRQPSLSPSKGGITPKAPTAHPEAAEAPELPNKKLQ